MYKEIGKMYEPADIIIYLQGKGLVLKEKSLVASDRINGKIIAVGTEAENIEKNPKENLVVYSPLRRGTVADFDAAVKLFTCLLHKALGKKLVCRPAIAICVPKDTSQVDKKAIEETIYQAGARKILIADIPVEPFIKELQEKSTKLYREFKIMIGITKDNPENYIRELLSDTLRYAAQEGISSERVAELLASAKMGCSRT